MFENSRLNLDSGCKIKVCTEFTLVEIHLKIEKNGKVKLG